MRTTAFSLFAHAGLQTQRQTGKSVSPLRDTMRVAVVGCAHGQLDAMYAAVREAEVAAAGKPVDLVVCPGDFQAIRNSGDLACMACPEKFRAMNSFWKYYNNSNNNNSTRAPIPTVFVGGNHEAPNHLQELCYGGLVAPNMYYLGDAGVVNFRGIRIAGVSGVYVKHHYHTERNEHPPYPRNQVKSVYHSRAQDVDRLMRLERGTIDIMVSHDWPQDIAFHGDKEDLLRRKPFLRKEIERHELGHPGTKMLLHKMQPRYWFAAHMHAKFAAKVQHPNNCNSETRFLALDKIIARRDFLQIIDIPVKHDPHRHLFLHDDTILQKVQKEVGECLFELDPEWLTILRSEAREKKNTITISSTSTSNNEGVTDEDIAELKERIEDVGLATACNSVKDFERTAPVHDPGKGDRAERPRQLNFPTRTKNIAEMLGVELLPVPPPVPGETAAPNSNNNNKITGVAENMDLGAAEDMKEGEEREGDEKERAMKKAKLTII